MLGSCGMLRALSVIIKDDVGAVGALLQACFPVPKARGQPLGSWSEICGCEVHGEG